MTIDRKTQCLEDLRMRILSLEIAPGTDLDEAALSETYGMSRTPLREVLQRLSGEGYVKLEQNRGAKVTSFDMTELRTFFQTAPLIYANIARQAAENRTAEQLSHLKDIQQAFKAANASRDAMAAAFKNHAFHALIGEMAHNPYLLASLERMLIDHTRLSQTFYRPASPEESMMVVKASEHHDAMISAIEAQEPSIMIDLTLQHWDLSRDRMERFVRPDPLPLDVVSLMEHGNAV